MPTEYDNAEARCIENLLNCYCREIAGPSGEHFLRQGPDGFKLRLYFSHARTILTVPIHTPSLTGAFECRGPCLITTQRAGWREVARLIIDETAAQQGAEAHPELLTLIEDSMQVSELLANAPRRRVTNFLESEQALTWGHPFHPSPKSRQGFSSSDLRRYSPELGARFPLHYFAVRHALVSEDSLLPKRCTTITGEQAPKNLSPGDDFALVPMHPWQAEFVRHYPLVQNALKRDEMRDLGCAGPDFGATSSVRTLYSPGNPYFYKTSLNVRITNCIRRTALHELRCSLEVSCWMRQSRPLMNALFPYFHALEEPAYLTVSLPGDENASARVAESFGLMLRDAEPLTSISNETTPLVAAALFGNRAEGRKLAAEIIGDHDRREWLAVYCERLIFPLLHCFFKLGLMFEPHLQNIVIGFKNGMPERIFLRDFDNAKVVDERRLPSNFARLRPEVQAELRYPHDQAWNRFIYCLLTNHLAEVAAMLADGNALYEAGLWTVLRETLLEYGLRHGDANARALIDHLISQPSLPAKGNLVTRALKRPDRAAAYCPVPNPMSFPQQMFAAAAL